MFWAHADEAHLSDGTPSVGKRGLDTTECDVGLAREMEAVYGSSTFRGEPRGGYI